MRADGDTDAAHLRSLPLPGMRLPLVPPEQRRPVIERLLDERARDPAAALPPAGRLSAGALGRARRR